MSLTAYRPTPACRATGPRNLAVMATEWAPGADSAALDFTPTGAAPAIPALPTPEAIELPLDAGWAMWRDAAQQLIHRGAL